MFQERFTHHHLPHSFIYFFKQTSVRALFFLSLYNLLAVAIQTHVFHLQLFVSAF